MVTFPNLVDFFPFRKRKLVQMERVQYFLSDYENCTRKTMDFSLANAMGLTEFGPLMKKI
jgi:hypothetical protein